MADNQKVSFTIEVRDDGSAVVKGFEGTASAAFKKTADAAEASGSRQISTFERMKASMNSLRQNWLAITAATAAIAYVVRDTVSAFLESDQAQNRLAKALANTGQLTRANYQALLEYSSAMQRATALSDDYINAQLAIMLSYRDQAGQVMTVTQAMDAMSAAADLAAGKDMDLATASDLMGKAFAGRTEMLSRYGIILNESIPPGEKFNALLQQINQSVGGAAQADMQSYAGQVRYLSEVWGDIKENVGLGFVKIAEAGLIAFKALGYSVLQIEILLAKMSLTVDSLAAKIPYIGKYFAQSAADTKAEVDALSVTADALLGDISKLQTMLGSWGDSKEELYKNSTAVAAVGTSSEKAAVQVAQLKEEQWALRDAMVAADQSMVEQINRVEELIDKYPELSKEQQEVLRGRASANDAESIDWYQEQYSKEIDARREANERLTEEQRQTNDQIRSDNEAMLRSMEQSWGDYLNLILNDYTSFSDMLAAIGRKILSDLAQSVFSPARLLASATMGIAGSGTAAAAGGGDMMGGSNSIFSGMLDKLTGMSNLWNKVVGPEGLLIDTHALPAGVAGPTMPANLTTLGASLASLAGAFGMYQGYQQGSPLSGALGGASLGAGIAGMGGAPLMSATTLAWAGPLAIAGLGMGFAGQKRAETIKRRMEMAEQYFEELKNLTETEYTELSALMADVDDTLSNKNLGYAIKYGELTGINIEELYGVSDALKNYKTATEESGTASLAAISAYRTMGTEMQVLHEVSRSWTGKAKEVAVAWEQVYGKIQKLQVKAITDELQSGATTFSAAMAKITMLDLGAADTAVLQYGEALKFLTTSTLPALSGELTKARDLLRETKEEMEKEADAAAGLDVKVQLLTSDLALTEEQLRAIKEGTVNMDMIDLARMMGDWDAQIVMVTTDTKEAVSVWKTLENANTSLQESLAGIAEKLKGVKDVNPELVQLYNNMQLMLVGINLVATAAQKLEKLPDIIERINKHSTENDLASLSADLVELADVALYTAAALDQIAQGLEDIGAARAAGAVAGIAGLLGPLGQILMVVQMIIDLFLIAQRGFQRWMQEMTQDAGFAGWVEDKIIKPIEAIGPIGKQIADEWRKNWFESGEEVKKSLRQVYEEQYHQQQLAAGATLYEKYSAEQAMRGSGYTNETDIGKQVDEIRYASTEALGALYDDYLKAIREGPADDASVIKGWMDTIRKGVGEEIAKITEDWQNSLSEIIDTAGMTAAEKTMHDLNKWYEDQSKIAKELGEPLDRVTTAYQEQRKALIAGVMTGINDTIATAGMSDYQKSVYAVNQQYDEIVATLTTYGATAEDIANAEIARTIALGDLQREQAEQREQEIKALADNWDAVIEGIQDKINSLQMSEYNVTLNPQQRGDDMGKRFQDALATLRGSSGEDFSKNYQNLEGIADQYLKHMLETYASSDTYQAAYKEVMAALQEASGLAQGQKANAMSEYERSSLTAQDAMVTYLSTLPDDIKTALTDGGAGLGPNPQVYENYYVEQQNTNLQLLQSNQALSDIRSRAEMSNVWLIEGNKHAGKTSANTGTLVTNSATANKLLTQMIGRLDALKQEKQTPIKLSLNGKLIAAAMYEESAKGTPTVSQRGVY